MQTFYINELSTASPETTRGIAATIGFFDGVHVGHRYLINQLKELAISNDLPSAVITFPVHPRKVLQTDYQPELLNSFDEKLEQLASTGIDYCFVIDFTAELSNLSAYEFIKTILQEKLNVRQLLIGYDHRFGKGRREGFEDYQRYGAACGMDVVLANEWTAGVEHASSTRIRRLLAEGKVEEANKVLSYPYSLSGTVIHGNEMGRTIGFPTANIGLIEQGKIVPNTGIYATRVYLNDTIYKGMTYIGKRPTVVDRGERRIEVNILDFEGDIYDRPLRIDFVSHLRDDVRFDSVEALKQQLGIDREMTLQVFTAADIL